ncbi:hypothetical protein AAFF_G00288510 [Aldrovandia affinis]|uniref:Threonylcarbamoyl-AMP synthase n=1 Tax=Aldrovandia affinis TaxID=143900 RepID=A0AAD7WS99_9TELE|nr:hypothetical protein AAFF_G00288510 [Aldrovandia affinis]
MSVGGFASVFYSEPAVLGLLANVFSAFYVALQNFSHVATGTPAHGLENTLAGVHLILIGGLVQLVAGLLTFRKYDHLAGTTFLAFSALWGSYGATRLVLGSWDGFNAILPVTATTTLPNVTATSLANITMTARVVATTILPNVTATSLANITMTALPGSTLPFTPPLLQPPPVSESAIAGLVAYISVAFIVTFCAATANYVMPVVFGAITVTLALEAIGLRATGALAASGVFQLVITLVGLYGAAALLLKGLYQRHVLPGFGNALFDVLLLGAAIKPSVRKQVGVLWVSFDAAAQLLASYYACLRGDAFHCTKFGLHLVFWLTLSWEEYVGTVALPAMGVGAAEVAEARLGLVGGWFFLLLSLLSCMLSLSRDRLELLHSLAFSLVTLAALPQIPTASRGPFLGVALALYSVLSLALSFISLVNSIAEKTLIPGGNRLVSTAKLQEALFGLKRCLTPRLLAVPPSPASRAELSARLPDALFFMCNGLAAFAAVQPYPVSHAHSLLALPGVLLPGALLQLYVARLQVRGGRRFGPTVPFCYAAIWATWSLLRFGDPIQEATDPSLHAFTAGAVAFLIINFFIIVIAAYSNIVLLIFTITMEALLVMFLLFTINKLPLPVEVGLLAFFALVCLYGALASLANHIFEKNLIPMGPKPLKSKKSKSPSAAPAAPLCPCPSSEKTSGLKTIANILNAGGVCGIPSDTVYTLSASCGHPAAIQRIYNIKDRPMEKPICLTIANLEQLVAVAPPFSPLLWEFMRHVYPGGIGCIVKKGEWLRKLGVGEAYDYVGTKDSIMIRISDLTVTAHLLSMTGPLAITSANPSGEPDSTHHDMVTRLADKLDGVLCDGDSTELVSSTVVICTKIDEGTLSFLREGAVPKAKVLQIFETVKNKMAATQNA